MKAKNYSCLLFGFLWWVSTSCDLTDKTPERLFNVIALGSNKISSNFAREFKEIRTQNANGLLKVAAEDRKSFRSAVSCTEFVNLTYVQYFDQEIKDLKALTINDETQPIIDAALDMFQYAEGIYKEEFVQIARMIDEGKADDEIDAAISQLVGRKGEVLNQKRIKAMELVLPYADKYGVDYKNIDANW